MGYVNVAFRHAWRLETADSLELELQVGVSCLTWMLGTELWSFPRAAEPSL